MNLNPDRLVAIISLMYGQRAELVINYNLDTCYLFLSGSPQYDMEIFYNEVKCLEYNKIVEFSSGNDEPGHETSVYVLTDDAYSRIKEILNDHQRLLLQAP